MAGSDSAIRRTIICPVEFRATDDEALLRETIHSYNDGCQVSTNAVWPARGQSKEFTNTAVQSATYDAVREQTRLGSQHAVLATHQSAQALRGVREHRANNKTVSKPEFASKTIRYDSRSMTVFDDDSVSLATVEDRIRVDLRLPSKNGEAAFQREFIDDDSWNLSESTLTFCDGEAQLHIGFKKPNPNAEAASAVGNGTVLGVDLNVTGPFAVTSTGAFIGSAGELNHERNEYEKRRGAMQQTGTRSAHQAICSVGDRFSNWSKEWLHHRSNALVAEAQDQDVDGIVFEQLTDIRDRISNGKEFQQWAFARFIELVRYKAEAVGVWVDTVRAHYTSKECSECGYVADANRSGKAFDCVACDNHAHADYDAAKMVAKKYMRLHGERTSHGGGATCQLALKSGPLPADAGAVFAVAWESNTVTDKPLPQ